MASENETVAEIVREMRNPTTQEWEKPDEVVLSLTDARTVVAHYSDRIEAAHKREITELRECLKEAIESMCKKCAHYDVEDRKCYNGKYNCIPGKWRKALEGANATVSEGGES